MSISYTGVSQNLTATRVLFYNDDTVRALAQAAMVNMAEATVEMLMDFHEDYATKADVERVFAGLHDQATDLINDVIDGLKERLLEELSTKKYVARVRAMHYDLDGELNDVDVQVDFE